MIPNTQRKQMRFFLDSMIDSVNMEPLFQMMVDKAA